jgi:hypothetical protein
MRQTADVRPSVSVPHCGKEGEHLFCAKPVSRGACCAFHFMLRHRESLNALRVLSRAIF